MPDPTDRALALCLLALLLASGIVAAAPHLRRRGNRP